MPTLFGRTLSLVADTLAVQLLDEGDVEIYEISADGTEIVYNILGPGEIFGEVGFVDGHPRTRWVRARSECLLWRVGEEQVEALPADAKILVYRFLTVLLAHRFRVAVGREEPELVPTSSALPTIHW